MITVISYIVLRHLFQEDYPGWLLFLPVVLDLTLIDRIGK
ncbi:hypothetical protein vBKpMFBKp34_107 [Klebsiella phage vB_KpM_FBKp34]|nr:hypothetical protein vBKpMFBKp34_107 [Klebsiella phage vB_KpM_FBKp34]